MIELTINNGRITTSIGTIEADIGIDKGQIVYVGKGSCLPEAKRHIDASGLHILPGLIDDHVHFRDPGLTYKEDFATGSRGAAAGGVTTIMDMPNTKPPTATVEALKEKLDSATTHSYVDFGIYGVLTEDNINQIEKLADAGVMGYKLFMGETTGNISCPSDDTLYEHFKKVKAVGLKIGAHAENDPILQHMKKKLMHEGRVDARAHLESRPSFAEHLAVSKAIILSEATGCPFHVFHLSSQEGLEEVIRAKKKGLPVTAEVLVAHLLFNDTYYESMGNLIRLNPPIRSKVHQQAMWRGIKEGWINNIATDHAPHSKEEKTATNVWDAACGFIGVETFLPLMLNEVNKGKLSLEELVRLSSEQPAKIWNIYPRKGALQIGSDADIVIVDMSKKKKIDATELKSKDKLTPYDGWEVKGVPMYTVLRGKVIMEEGKVQNPPTGIMVKPTRRGLND